MQNATEYLIQWLEKRTIQGIWSWNFRNMDIKIICFWNFKIINFYLFFLCTFWPPLPLSPTSQPPLATTNLFSVSTSMGFCYCFFVFWVSHIRDHTAFVFLCLTYFTYHNALEVHPYWCKWQDFILFYGWIIFHCMNIHDFFIHSFMDGHLGCFCVLAIVNSATMKMGMHISFWVNIFVFFG